MGITIGRPKPRTPVSNPSNAPKSMSAPMNNMQLVGIGLLVLGIIFVAIAIMTW